MNGKTQDLVYEIKQELQIEMKSLHSKINKSDALADQVLLLQKKTTRQIREFEERLESNKIEIFLKLESYNDMIKKFSAIKNELILNRKETNIMKR